MIVLTPDGTKATEILAGLGVSAWVAGRVGGSSVEIH
jgi:hypothetical protein